MPFTDPIVADTTLVRDAIQSPDYISGSTGWTINRDGTAEFNNVTVRGTITGSVIEVTGSSSYILVYDPSGSYIQLSDTSSSAIIDMRPADLGSYVIVPAELFALSFSASGSDFVGLSIVGPNFDGYAYSSIGIFGEDPGLGTPESVQVSGKLSVQDIVITGSIDTLVADHPSASTTSGFWTSLSGLSMSFTKQYDQVWTKLHITLTTGWRLGTTSSFTMVGFGVLINGYDYWVTKCEKVTLNEHFTTTGEIDITDLDAGTYTVQVRWIRIYGSATLLCDSNDRCHLTVEEVGYPL